MNIDYNNISSKFNKKVLSPAPDETLQKIVLQASSVSGFPIALINLVLKRTQFFRAQVGLSNDLKNIQSTDRCISFCQYVVNSKKPLMIKDAQLESSLPQHMVKLYGIRAYYGVPVKINNEVVGSLCTIDYKPRDIDTNTENKLKDLAEQASTRLSELAAHGTSLNLSTHSDHGLWQDLDNSRTEIEMAMTELRPLIQAVKSLNLDINTENGKKLSILQEATDSFDDLKMAISKLDHVLKAFKGQSN